MVLRDRILLRNFEKPVVYNAKTDELYELDEEAFEFLRQCDGGKEAKDSEFVRYCIENGILEFSDEKRPVHVPSKSLRPSLRHMLVHVTLRCNLNCRHCYLPKKQTNMDYRTFNTLIEEFSEAGGIKLMLSGGEPLLHPEIYSFLDVLESYDFRKVLITNGTLIDEKNAGKIEVDEVQISIDGIKSHDFIRGKGTFEKAMRALKLLIDYGVDVSVATMVHRYNIDEFDEMEKLFKGTIKSWMVDYPSLEGNLRFNEDILVEVDMAVKIMSRYGFGDFSHRVAGYTCGAHMCASDPEGNISRCGFFESVGNIRDGLANCWRKLTDKCLWSIDEIEVCRDCGHRMECSGGCRFRAKTLFGGIKKPDRIMCGLYGRV
ncbi:radical SAM/SPASM domain-containing protein [Archaeoglobus sulfaticallidus]|uniref:radical SAM/SPASM domain-containing protein n=1 Tax=Archaeoglobus sulfaticallidus TaxID=1316941 RepID=UPI00064F4DC6|nr:radical SAM protein [Archaeoglobus sulfaticallidus]